ncbi:transcriptional regulator [Reticulibacter mediterranei]|uniref:Transcriptional regulator n=1 Tax=Reticulibacter mediterranei TaxID=2778369 RepID=A0A8J3N5S7_9CHLR|nr:TetR/AcrR family transcriptional regulator [Reticulibacter mediterranei]GHO96803.1 transcriptional regulator [Reticulibacter mediterranei]
MSQIPGDLRVRRTQKLIWDAFIVLVEERSFDAITVGEITSRAMVSRTAFYRYYQDKYDLVEKMFEEIVRSVNSEMDLFRRDVVDAFDGQYRPKSWKQLFEYAEALTVPEPLVTFFEHVIEYEQLYRALLGKKGSSWFVTRMREYLAEIIGERLQELVMMLNRKPLVEARAFADGFVATLIAAQFVAAITWWLEQEKPYTPHQIATYCYRTMCSLLKDVHTWDEK